MQSETSRNESNQDSIMNQITSPPVNGLNSSETSDQDEGFCELQQLLSSSFATTKPWFMRQNQHEEWENGLQKRWKHLQLPESESERIDLALSLLSTVSSPYKLHEISNFLRDHIRCDFVSCLPRELAVHVLSFLPLDSLTKASRVSKYWNRLSREPQLWRTMFHLQRGWRVNQAELALFRGKPTSFAPSNSDLNAEGKADNNAPVDSSPFLSDGQTINWAKLYRARMQIQRNFTEGRYKLRTLYGHTDAIYTLQADFDKVISGARDNTVRVWNIKTGHCDQVLHEHTKSVLCLQFDKNRLVTGSSDKTIICWDIRTVPYRVEFVLKGHTDSVLNLKMSGDILVTAGKDRFIGIWDLKERQIVRFLNGHRAAVNSVCLKGDQYVISASGDRTIRVWELQTGKKVREMIGHPRGVACLQVDGDIVASGSTDLTIRIWDFNTGDCLKVLMGHSELVRTLQLRGDFLISGSYDQTIKIWNWREGTIIKQLEGHIKGVYALHLSLGRLISASQDQKIIVRDFAHEVDSRFFE